MGKVIGRIYKYDQRNWPYPYPNNNFIIPPHFYTSIQAQRNSDFNASAGANNEASAGLYTSIQTQCNSDSYVSVGSNYASLFGLDQITNHHCNMDSKNDDDSRSYKTPQKQISS